MTIAGAAPREVKPAFKVELDGVDVTDSIGDRLIALRTTDYAGQQTDTVEIELDDRDQRIPAPPSGATMSVALGYEGMPLQLVGVFIVDEVEFSDGPRGMVVKGLGAAEGGPTEGLTGGGGGGGQVQQAGAPSLPPAGTKKPNTGAGGDLSGARDYIKLRRTQDWHNPPYPDLLSIARTIAGRNQLALEVKGDVPKIPNRHEDQTNESDANFMTRLADRFGLVIKPVDGRLLVTTRGDGAVGKNVNIKREDCESWRARVKERARYKVVRAKYLDRKSRKEKLVDAKAKDSGGTGSTFELPELHHTKEDAERAAQAKVRGLTSGVFGIDLVLRGTPTLTAEGTVTLSGFREEVDETWVIRSVSHQITGRAVFTTTVQAGTEGDASTIEGAPEAAAGGAAPGNGGGRSGSIAAAASQSVGMSTTSSGLGRNPCLWSVNRVLARAGVTPPWGNSNYVPTARSALANGGGTLLAGPEPGAIAIFRDNGNPPYPHVGVVLPNNQIASSSSNRQRFDWVASDSSYTSHYGRKPEYWRLK